MISDMSSGNIYLNVVARINQDYGELIEHLRQMDTRVAYLKMFELSLSSALPKPLWDVDAYRIQSSRTPMPSDPYGILPFETFRAWMTVYEMVMRDEGLIGTRQQSILGMDDDTTRERSEV